MAMTDSPRTETGYVEHLADDEHVQRLKERLSRNPKTWTTFRGTISIDLVRPYSNHCTPHAIYGLPTERLIAMADEYLGMRRDQKLVSAFHEMGYARRPNAVVFNPHGLIVRSSGFEQLEECFAKLLEHLALNYPEAVSILEQQGCRWKDVPDMAANELLWLSEMVVDFLTLDRKTFEANEPFRCHPEKPYLWREMMLAMDISAFEDWHGLLIGGCIQQIAVFDVNSIQVIDAFENPAAAPENVAYARNIQQQSSMEPAPAIAHRP